MLIGDDQLRVTSDRLLVLGYELIILTLVRKSEGKADSLISTLVRMISRQAEKADSHILTFPHSLISTFSHFHISTFSNWHIPTFSHFQIGTFTHSNYISTLIIVA
ncbi:MAG TPA: hypothetical protein DCS15_00595 [Flavobacteriales bacterium]|nr:hypothetical protein [Flavobacteriales bacterium]